jgi:hypothetical protein
MAPAKQDTRCRRIELVSENAVGVECDKPESILEKPLPETGPEITFEIGY